MLVLAATNLLLLHSLASSLSASDAHLVLSGLLLESCQVSSSQAQTFRLVKEAKVYATLANDELGASRLHVNGSLMTLFGLLLLLPQRLAPAILYAFSAHLLMPGGRAFT